MQYDLQELRAMCTLRGCCLRGRLWARRARLRERAATSLIRSGSYIKYLRHAGCGQSQYFVHLYFEERNLDKEESHFSVVFSRPVAVVPPFPFPRAQGQGPRDTWNKVHTNYDSLYTRVVPLTPLYGFSLWKDGRHSIDGASLHMQLNWKDMLASQRRPGIHHHQL